MILSYGLRLLVLAAGAFFLIHLAASGVVLMGAPAACRRARRMPVAEASRLLLWVRLLPTVMALGVVIGLCIPAYLWLEPRGRADEAAGMVALAMGGCGLAVFGGGLLRGLWAVANSARFARACRRIGRRIRIAGEPWPVWVLRGPAAPLAALTGVWTPQLMISEQLLEGLPEGELAAVLAHEHAHWRARDNLKHLLVLAAPDALPFARGFGEVERQWRCAAEWAADRRSVSSGDAASTTLASALVHAARMSAAAQEPVVALATALAGSHSSDDLRERVERLLGGEQQPRRSAQRWANGLVWCAAVLTALCAVPSLNTVHAVLEAMLR
jgi:hypothetical protein